MSAAITALVVSAVSTGASMYAGSKAKKAQKKGNEAQRAINALKNKQAKRAYLRQFRQAQAAALQASIAAGVGLESSAFQGTISSQAAQAGTAAGEFLKFDELGGEVANQANKAANYQFNAGVYSQVAGFASQFISFTPKVGEVGKVGPSVGSIETKSVNPSGFGGPSASFRQGSTPK